MVVAVGRMVKPLEPPTNLVNPYARPHPPEGEYGRKLPSIEGRG